MAALDLTQASTLVSLSLGKGGSGATTGVNVRLGTSAVTPNGTTNMTQLSGTGYTAGGTSTAFSTPSAGSSTNTGTPSWTNGGTSWTISYIELWDQAGTPLRWWYGAWTGQPITVANGNTFAVAASAITASLS